MYTVRDLKFARFSRFNGSPCRQCPWCTDVENWLLSSHFPSSICGRHFSTTSYVLTFNGFVTSFLTVTFKCLLLMVWSTFCWFLHADWSIFSDDSVCPLRVLGDVIICGDVISGRSWLFRLCKEMRNIIFLARCGVLSWWIWNETKRDSKNKKRKTLTEQMKLMSYGRYSSTMSTLITSFLDHPEAIVFILIINKISFRTKSWRLDHS